MKDVSINNQKYRTRILFSILFCEVYNDIGCNTGLLSSYIEMVFCRKNGKEDRRMNGSEVVTCGKTGNKKTKSYFLIEEDVLESIKRTYPDSILFHAHNNVLEKDEERKGFYRIKILSRRNKVEGRIYLEQYISYKELLNLFELELFLRTIIENSNGAYYFFSKDTLFSVATRSKDILSDTGVVIDNSTPTMKKRITRMIDKLIKGGAIKQYGKFYSNAPNEIEYQKCIGETEEQWRKEMCDRLHEQKNKIYKQADEIEKKNEMIEELKRLVEKYENQYGLI